MNNTTISKLNSAAKILSAAFVADVGVGQTTRDMCVGHGSDIEFIKFAIRKDKRQIAAAFRMVGVDCSIVNVCKTQRQLNYLANEIVYRLRSSKSDAYKRATAVAFGSRRGR